MPRVRRAFASALAGILVLTTSGGPSTLAAPVTPTYLNAHAPISDRVSDLLGRMTLVEKAGQMDQILIGNLRGDCQGTNGPLVPSCMNTVFVQYATGSILAGGTDNPLTDTAMQWALDYNQAQRYAITHSRLHIPVIFGLDAVHGFSHPVNAPLFPQQIGMGATWDPNVAWQAGAATGRALEAVGWVWDFAPVQDLSRDARWGRYYETWAEAPALDGAMGASFVTGFQNPTHQVNELGTAATVKHFAGYSQSINGHDRVEELLPIRYLQDTMFPGYAAAIKAGARTVMVNSGSVNGVPATASHYLLTDVLRGQMGFRGVTISDYGDVRSLQTAYHLTSNYPDAIALAVNAGVDMAMEPSNPADWVNGVVADVNAGKIPMWRINQAVARILTLKFQLHLFDDPFVNPAKAEAVLQAGRAAALQASEESITLLQNKSSALPLAMSSKVVVTGPNADNIPAQLGGWSVSWQGVFGAGQACCASLPGQIPPTVTVLKGIQNAIGSGNVNYQPTQAGAVAAASSAGAIVAVVGETMPYAEGLGDRPDVILDSDQQAMLAALEATGKPVIVVVIAGRPLGLGPGYNANAILMAYQGGTETGTAVADVIFGKTNPSGHLSVTWPSATATWTSGFNPGGPSQPGDQPKFYDQLPGTNSGVGSGYNPAFPIGTGLSYTTFSVSGLSVGAHPSGGKLPVTFTVTNTGTRAGATVVPIWVSEPPLGAVAVPPRQLAGFARVTLAAGATRTVHVWVSLDWLRITAGDVNGQGPRVLPTGAYTLFAGAYTATTPTATFMVP